MHWELKTLVILTVKIGEHIFQLMHAIHAMCRNSLWLMTKPQKTRKSSQLSTCCCCKAREPNKNNRENFIEVEMEMEEFPEWGKQTLISISYANNLWLEDFQFSRQWIVWLMIELNFYLASPLEFPEKSIFVMKILPISIPR